MGGGERMNETGKERSTMTHREPVASAVAATTLLLTLSGCNVGHSQPVSKPGQGRVSAAEAEKKAPALSQKATAKDIAAYVAYWKKMGYTVLTNQQVLNPDGTVKTYRFAAKRGHGKGADDSETVATTITDSPPPEAVDKPALAKAAAKTAPSLSETSTAKDIAAYVAYYEGLGYTVTVNQQAFSPQGTVKTFRFAANRTQGADRSRAGANINVATHTVSTSEQTQVTTP